VRRLLVVLGVVAASLGLSACGSATKASINESVASLGASTYLQVHLTGSVSGAGMAKAQKVLKGVSIDMRYQNPSGGPLSQVNDKANAEFVFNLADQSFADIRVVDSNIYLKVDLSSLNGIPGLNVTPAQLAGAQLLLGGRWFELSKDLLSSVVPTPSTAAQAKAAANQAVARKIIDAIVSVIDSAPAKALSGGGYSETGTLKSIVDAVAPTIQSITHSTTGPGSVKGTYTLKLTTSGSTATGASISITAPNGSKGNATIILSATVAHANDAVTAPSGATLITPALLKMFQSSAG
jgi:hypothetical protein